MEFRNLGRSGLTVSAIGLGCNNFGGRIDLAESRKVVHKALDCGITLFDTADVYGDDGGSETCLGRILGKRRNDIILATKFGKPMQGDGPPNRGGRRYIVRAIEESLKRLQTDWIDLYQLHESDPATPIEETLRALDDLIRAGKVRYIGCSNLPAWQVVEAEWTARRHNLNAFICCQDEYSLLVRDPEAALIPAMVRYHLGLLPYFPLGAGLLTGKYRRGAALPEGARITKLDRLQKRFLSEANWTRVEGLREFASAHGHTLLELAFSWLLARPQVSSVIAGATSPEQVGQNVTVGGWVLTADDLAAIDRIASEVPAAAAA